MPRLAVGADDKQGGGEMTEQELQAIEERWGKAQKGPWMWDVNAACHQAHLTTTHSGRIFILGFQRWGFHSAQPMFQDYQKGIVEPLKRWAKARFSHHPDFDMDIDHPDAQAIASAPTDIAALLEEVRRLRCCGNCKQYIPHCQEGYKPYDKCDEWEAADNG